MPALVGTALIGSTYFGYGSAALSIGALVLLVSLIFLRNWVGILVALCFCGSRPAAGGLYTQVRDRRVVLSLGLMLLIGGVRDLFKVLGVHISRRELIASSDAYLLATRSWVPAWVWLLGFIVVVGACVVASTMMLSLMLRV